MQILATWLEGSRPKTWIASISPVVIGTLLAPRSEMWIFVVTLLCALFIQIGTNLANDYYDCIQGKDTKARVGPRRIGASGMIAKNSLFQMMVATFCIGFCFCSLLISRGGWSMGALYLIAVGLGVFYTKKPIAYGYKGASDLIVLFGFGSIATFFTTYLQTLTFSYTPLLVGLAPGFFSVALLALNNVRDFEEDTLTQKNTLVVRFGQKFGKMEVTAGLLLPFMIAPNPLNIFLIPLVYSILQKLWDGSEMRELLNKIGITFIFFTLFYGIKACFL